MKLNDLIMVIEDNTRIRIVMQICGTKFFTEHYREIFLVNDEMSELLQKEVDHIRVTDNTLVVALK